MKKKLALRLIAAALAVAMVGSLTACDNSGETASTGGGASASDSGDSGDSGDGGEESKFAERVALDVVAHHKDLFGHEADLLEALKIIGGARLAAGGV